MPDDIIIRAENLGKRYVLAHQASGSYHKFSDTLVHFAKAPFRALRSTNRPHQEGTSEEFWALKDLSFEIKRGDVVGIIGRNGAGKSTLLKILSRITEPTAGRIALRGRVASLLEVGTGFHPELTGRENIFLNGAILGMTKAEIRSKFDEIVAFAEIERFLDTPVKRYSSGMYVRLAFAVAAHLEPEILIVDEVLAVGDAQFQAKCLGKIQDVATGGRTVLFVSHNLSAVRNLCRSGLLLSQGTLVQNGPIAEVVDAYLSKAGTAGTFQPRTNRESYISGCELTLSDGSPTTAPLTNDELHVVIRYTNRKLIRGLRVGFSLATADGTIIAVCGPEDEGVQTDPTEGEHCATAIIAKNHLMKGAHRINVAVWDGIDGTIYDDVQAIVQFQIEAARERAYASEYQRAGVLQLPLRWSMTT